MIIIVIMIIPRGRFGALAAVGRGAVRSRFCDLCSFVWLICLIHWSDSIDLFVPLVNDCSINRCLSSSSNNNNTNNNNNNNNDNNNNNNIMNIM